MKRLFSTIMSLAAAAAVQAQNRFPKPDFESGYQYPDHEYAVPNEIVWDILDVTMLVALLVAATWAVMKKRKPMLWISIVSVLYFGFFREGCVCSVGTIQNVALALVDGTYNMPWNVLAFFLLPVVFAFFFGRVFCAGVCPMGALQELVNVKNGRISKPVAMVLGLLPWLYLILTILYAITHSRFLVCEFDPFIGIFRLGGNVELLAFGILLLIISVFTGRPFCRFL
ncbi:MAG: 4Fe-4S binding protein, partial [Alistipes sp.]|nr:4Fe-4S binding protein [Alistipes sp.]